MTKIKILMMFKDEDELLLPWFRYHMNLIGKENLIVLDNGSTSAQTLNSINLIEAQLGGKINKTYASPADFQHKGKIISEIIREFDIENPADFYLPMDCDEFIAVGCENQISMDHHSILEELDKFSMCRAPLRIAAGLDNRPNDASNFRWSKGQKKTFFAKASCKYLDHGYHSGATVDNLDPLITKIVYVHFHYRPYDTHLRHARAKLAPYLDDFSDASLKNYVEARKSGYHCARYMLTPEHEYYSMFNTPDYRAYPEVEKAFNDIGEKVPFSRM